MSQFSQIEPTPRQRAAAAPAFASILIVDDQGFDRMRLDRICRNLGFHTQVVQADSLAQMAQKLKKDKFDLVLLDYHLTDGTGLEGVELIRADKVNHDAATVMITGTEDTDIAVQALKLGFSDYLAKEDLSEEGLCRTAITALQKSRLAGGMDRSMAPEAAMSGSVQSFSRACVQDIKPIVSRMMRQMRNLRDLESIDPEEAADRIARVEGSLRRLWSFLEELEQTAGPAPQTAPTVAATRGAQYQKSTSISLRVPSLRAAPVAKTPRKPPSVFRRRPDQGAG